MWHILFFLLSNVSFVFIDTWSTAKSIKRHVFYREWSAHRYCLYYRLAPTENNPKLTLNADSQITSVPFRSRFIVSTIVRLNNHVGTLAGKTWAWLPVGRRSTPPSQNSRIARLLAADAETPRCSHSQQDFRVIARRKTVRKVRRRCPACSLRDFACHDCSLHLWSAPT